MLHGMAKPYFINADPEMLGYIWKATPIKPQADNRAWFRLVGFDPVLFDKILDDSDLL